MDFFNYLYFGLGYEYHAAGHFWRLGYEAFKIDADFGFDLLVYNQSERTHKGNKDGKPYLIQVKAARVYKWEEHEQNAGLRKEAKVRFKLRKDHYLNLINEENSFLVCYIVEPGEEEKIISYFCLSNKQLKYLSEGKNPRYRNSRWRWFKELESENKVYLEASVHIKADLNLGYKRKIEQIKEYNEKLASELEQLVDRSEIINKNTNTYIKLHGENTQGSDSSEVIHSDFMKLGMFNKNDINKNHPFVER